MFEVSSCSRQFYVIVKNDLEVLPYPVMISQIVQDTQASSSQVMHPRNSPYTPVVCYSCHVPHLPTWEVGITVIMSLCHEMSLYCEEWGSLWNPG